MPIISKRPIDQHKLSKSPLRMISGDEDNAGLLLFPPGTEIIKNINISKKAEIEEALTTLSEELMFIDSIRTLVADKKVVVEITTDMHEAQYPRMKKVLGSFIVSLVGCALAYTLNRPVTFQREKIIGKKVQAEFGLP